MNSSETKFDLSSDKVLFTTVGIRRVQFTFLKLAHPENAIIVTDKHILLIYVPMLFGDWAQGKSDFRNSQSHQDKIDEKLKSLLTTKGLEEILAMDRRNVVLDRGKIQRITANPDGHIVIFNQDGTKIDYYSFLRGDDLTRCINQLSSVKMS